MMYQQNDVFWVYFLSLSLSLSLSFTKQAIPKSPNTQLMWLWIREGYLCSKFLTVHSFYV